MKKGEIESEPSNWRVLGRYYLEANMNDQAIKVLKEAAGLFPTKGEIEMQIAQIYTQMENNRDSLKHAKLAIQKGNFEGTKPFSAHDLGEIDEAKAAIEKASSFEESKKDAQFPRLKAVIEEAIAEREAKKSEKAPKAKS
jgi:cytochrome c-type biogenesis protein CcmH/NrfG